MNFKFGKILSVLIIITAMSPESAFAWQFSRGRTAFKLNGQANVGLMQFNSSSPDFINDWHVRAQANYAVYPKQTLGLVYSIDEISVDEKNYIRDAFAFWETGKLGRIEFGFTDSIARKLGIGLPDVGGLRINDKPLFYRKIRPKGPVIPDAILSTGQMGLRLNLASLPTNLIQGGLSVAGLTDNYAWTVDLGLKFRQGLGKTKTALSLAASFMNKPDNYRMSTYTPKLKADWRIQTSMGINLQYNSWVWGLSARAVYDKNPVGTASDGIAVGTGLSYDVFNFSLSVNYLLSDTGIWNKNAKDYLDHNLIASLRYKYDEYIDCWISGGITTKTPFVSAGLRLTF